MKLLVFHDAETVGDDDLAPFPSWAVHLCSADTAWEAGRGPDHRMQGTRDAAVRSHLIALLEELSTAVHRRWPGALEWAGVDILEVALYDWLYAIGPVCHPAAVARAIVGSDRPDQLVWRVEPGRRGADFGARLAAVSTDTGIEATVEGSLAPPRGHVRVMAGRARRRAQRAGGLVRRAMVSEAPSLPVGGLLLVDAYAHTAKTLGKLGAALTTMGEQAIFVGSTAEVACAVDGGCPSVALRDVVGQRALLDAARFADTVAALVPKIAHLAGDPVASPWGPLASLVEPGFATVTERILTDAAVATVLTTALVERTSPSAVVTTNLVTSVARAASLAGRHRGLPSVWVQHGLLRIDEYKTRITQEHFLCWGERDRRLLTAVGRQEEQVVVTGPLHAAVLGRPTAVPATATSVLYLPSRTSGNMLSQARAEQLTAAVVDATRRTGDTLLVKPHPGDPSSHFDDLVSDQPHATVRRGPLAESLDDAQVVVVATSTAGFEACAAGRDVIVLGFPGVELPSAYTASGAVLVASDRAELVSCLDAARMPGDATNRRREAAARLTEDMFFDLSGGAPGRAAAAILPLTRPDPVEVLS